MSHLNKGRIAKVSQFSSLYSPNCVENDSVFQAELFDSSAHSHHGDLAAAAEGVPVDGGDERLLGLADRVPRVDEGGLVRRRKAAKFDISRHCNCEVDIQIFHSLHCLHLLDVCACGEGLLAARHHHAAHGVVAVAVLQSRNLRGK